MSHNATLIDQLNNLRQHDAPSADRPRTLQGQVGSVEYEVEVREVDSIGCRLRRARIAKSNSYSSPDVETEPKRSRHKSKSVTERAEELCQRMGYLSEDLALMEAEESAGVAIARSATTTPQAGGNEYFEAIVTPNEIDLQRYRARPGEERESTDFSITHETLQRIVDDAAATMMVRKSAKSKQ